MLLGNFWYVGKLVAEERWSLMGSGGSLRLDCTKRQPQTDRQTKQVGLTEADRRRAEKDRHTGKDMRIDRQKNKDGKSFR